MIGPDDPVRVFVVDDESLAREDVVMLLGRLGAGFALAGEAADGRRALEGIAGSGADIVVLDITMPILDGRAVMRGLRAAGSRARIVVLSGYAEFEYAREAIAAGAVDYLLKPIDDAEFARVMGASATAVRAERAGAAVVSAAPAPWLARLAHDVPACPDGSAPEAARFLEGRPWYAMAAVHVAAANRGRAADLVARWFRGAPGFCSAGGRTGAGDWLVLVAAPDRDTLERVLADVARAALEGDPPGTPPSLGFSAARADPALIAEAAREAREALKHRLVDGPGRAHRHGAHPAAEGDSAMGIIQAGIEQLRAGMRDIDAAAKPKRFRDLLDGIFTADLVAHAGVDQLRRAYAEIVHLVLDAGDSPLAPAPRAAMLSGDAIDEAETVAAVKDSLCALLAERLGTPHAVDGRHLAAEARRLIDERYAEPLSLKGVADRLGFNPTYLSELFKREVGVNFGAYLTMVRTEAAKRLLARTDLPIRAVAAAVGYAYPEYFQRVFRRREGVAPEAWRRARAAAGPGPEQSSAPA